MSDDTNTDELDELRKQTSTGNRLEADDPTAQPEFIDALVAALDEIDSGELSETVTAYDPKLAAVLQALEDDDQLEDVFTQLQETYNGEAGLNNPSRSAIIRLAVRVGLQEGTADVIGELREAIERRQTTTV